MWAMERKGWDAVVVGAGAIGLACARALARAGRSVLVLDRGEPAAEATRAAGGMLSPLGEADGAGPFLELGMRSLELWPAFAAGLEGETGVALDLRTDGKLLLALDDAAVEALRRRQRWVTAAGFASRWLEGAALREREPAASPDARAGLHLDAEGQVDNRALGRALLGAATAAGCVVRGHAAAREIVSGGGRVRAVRTRDGSEAGCDLVVLAAGAWSGGLGGLPRPLPVAPVKGQMLGLALPAAGLRTVVETDACYLIPRRGNGASLWVGATSEDAGFTRGTGRAALDALRRRAARVVPAVADAREVEAWDGFRPGTPDHLPVLGPDPELCGLIHATGHFRNGILLTPVTARLVADAAAGRPDPLLACFRPDRFAAA